MICLRCGSINVESIEHVAERSGKVRLSLNRMGTWMKCGECGLTFLWDEPKPKQPTFQASPYVYVDLMERDEEEPESDGLPIVIPQDLDDEEGDEDDER